MEQIILIVLHLISKDGEVLIVIAVSSAKDAVYAVSSDVRIKGGTFSLGDANQEMDQDFELNFSNLSITTSSGDEALEIKSYVKLDKGSNDFTIQQASGTRDKVKR